MRLVERVLLQHMQTAASRHIKPGSICQSIDEQDTAISEASFLQVVL